MVSILILYPLSWKAERHLVLVISTSKDQLPLQGESLVQVAWEGHERIVLERRGNHVTAVVSMEEYIQLHPEY